MVKKLLLLKVAIFWLFTLSTVVGYGQCPTSVDVTANSGTTICAEDSITFTANLTGGVNPLYQWQINGLNISNAAGQTFTTSDVNNGDKVRVVVKSSTETSCVTNSEFITVTVNPKPSVTTANTATICSGASPNISLTASTPSSFSWTIGTITGNITGASAGSGSSINQTLTNPSSSAAGSVQYIVTPTANAGSCEGSPYTITVSVNPKTSVTTANTATICSGANPNISLTASTPSTFSWTVGTITGGITGASAGSGFTINQTLTNSSSSAAGSVQYIVTPTANAGSCEGSPYTITVNVNPKPTVTTVNTATICSGASPNISLTASTPSTFSWTVGTITGGITGASAGSGSSINQTLTNSSSSAAGSVQYIVTPTATAGSCEGSPYTITVSVNPKPTVTTVNTATICSGASPNISLTASTPSTFSWTVGTITGGITGASAGSGSTINQALTNPSSSAAGSVQYIVTPTANAGSCEGSPYTITVSVNPKPSVTTANTATICSGASPNISLTASTPSTFSWTVGTITGGITGASAGSGSSINQTLTNSSNSVTGSVQYIVTPTANAGSCEGSPYTITVTVNPTPSVTTVNTATICSGASPNISLTASTPSTFSWTVGTITGGITGASAGSGSTINQTLTNPSSSTAGSVKYIVTPTATAGSCTSSPYTITVNVNPTLVPTVTITSTSTAICTTSTSGSNPVTFTATPVNGGPSPSYQWLRNGTSISGATNSTYTANFLVSGSTISVEMTSNATCGSPSTATSNSLAMTGYTPPVAPVFSPTPSTGGPINTTLLCPPNTGLVYTVAPDPNVTSYNWTLPSGWVITTGGGTNSITINNSNLTAGTYNLIATAQNACGSSSTTLSITIDTAASVYAGADASICKGGNYIISDADYSGYIKTNGTNAPTWTASPGGSGTFNNPKAKNPTFTPLPNFTGTITLTLTSTKTQGTFNCEGLSDQMVLTVNAPPAITAQPSTTVQDLCLNDTPMPLSVTATGAGLTYQWYSNTTNSNSGGTSLGAGATSSTYTPETTSAGTLYYYVVVSGTCTPPVTSNPSGAITVKEAPEITAQPTTTAQNLCLNEAATQLSVTATGAGLTYQWYSNTTNSNSGGTSLGAGATSSTYTPETTSAGTLYYYVVVSGTCTPPVTSNTSGAVTVNEAPEISVQPSTTEQTLCLDDTASQLSVTATGAGLTYQWYSNTTNSNSGGTSLGAGATSSTYTPKTTSAGTLYYYVVVSGTCTPPMTSNTSGAVTVNEAPAITAQPSTTEQTLCLGAAATELSVTATGAGLTYQWYSNTTNSNSGGTSLGTSATSSTYTPATSSAGTLYYYVVVSGTCTPPITSNASGAVTVNEAPEITAQPSITSQTLCSYDTATQLSVTATGTGLTYQWYSNTTNSNSGGTSLGAGATSSSYTPETTSAGTLYYYVVVSGTCTPPVTSNTSGAITVEEAPTIIANPSTNNQILCEDASATALTVEATGAGLTYQWYNNTTNSNSGGTLINGATSSTYTPVITTAGTSYYYVVVSGTCTPAATSEVSGAVTVNEPVIITKDLDNSKTYSVCAGFPLEFSIEATGTDLTYEWSIIRENIEEIIGENSPTLLISQATETHEGTYKVTVQGSCGTEESLTVEVEVNQSIIFNTGGQPEAEINSCEADSNPITISVDVTGTISEYLWRKNKIPLSNGNGISGVDGPILTIADQTSEDSGSYDVVITSPAESCSQIISLPSIVTVNSKSTDPDSASATESTICLGNSIALSLNGGGGGTGEVIKWYTDSQATSLVGTGNNLEVTPDETTTYYGRFEDPKDCYQPSAFASVEVTVNFDSTIGLSENSGSNEQTICINNPLTSIVYNIGGGATGASIIEGQLPTGVEGIFSGNTFTIGGSPTESGTFSYTVTTEGPCEEKSLSGTIKVNPATVASIAAVNQELEICYSNGTAYNITAGASVQNEASLAWSVDPEQGTINDASSLTDATFTPLEGVSNPVMITLTSYGLDGCSNATATKTILVNQKPDPPTVENLAYCLDEEGVPVLTAIKDNGATLNWYDAVDATTALGTAPQPNTTTATTTSYWVSQTSPQGCESERAQISITINPLPVVTAAAQEIEICLGSPAELSATGGVSYIWYYGEVEIGSQANISYTPTTAEEYTFTVLVTDDNGCTSTAEVNVVVDKNTNAGNLTGPASVCVASPNGTLTLADYTGEIQRWEKSEDGETNWTAITATSETYNFSNLTSPTSFRAIIKNGVCGEIPSNIIDVTIDALPEGGELSWSTGERIFLTCEVQTNDLHETLTLAKEVGQITGWEYRTASSLTWTPYDSQSSSLTNTDFKNMLGGTVESTVFRAIITNGACTGEVFSQTAILSVIPSNIKPSPVQVDPNVVCYGNEITLSSGTGYGAEYGKFEGGDFTNAGIKNNGWDFTDPNGNEINYNANADSGTPIHWHKTQPKWKFTTAEINAPYTTSEQWWNPRNDGKQNEHFAIAQSTYSSNMDTPEFTLSAIDEGVLTFDQAFNLTTNATIRVVLLKNGVEYKELYKVTGPASSSNYDHFGYGTPGVNQMSIDLGSYIGESNLRIRFEYRGVRLGDIWAVDNIKVPEGPQDVLLQWFYDEDATNPNNELEQIGQDNENIVSFTPRKIGWNDFEVKTALLLDSNGDPCETINNSETIRVFVYDQYTTTVTTLAGACGSTRVELTATTEGAFQGDVTSDFTTGSYKTIDGYTGEWVISGDGVYTLTNPDGSASNPDPKTNPNAVFEAENLGDYTFTWKLTPTAIFPDDYKVESLRGQPVVNTGCPPIENPTNLSLPDCTTLDFDGDDDHILLGNNYIGNYFIEAWVRPFDRPREDGSGMTDASKGTIISTPKMEIRMGELSSKITKNTRWYHIAVSNTGELWIDGVSSGSIDIKTSGISTSTIGARYDAVTKTTSNHFSGWIDELRIWNKAPTEKQIRFMMNQRIKLDVSGTVVSPLQGEVVPNLVIADGGLSSYYTNGTYNLDQDGTPFYNLTTSDLAGYYRLYSDNPDPDNVPCFIIVDNLKPSGGYTPDHALNKVPGRLVNITTDQENTSPTPYCSGADGIWADANTWARPEVWDYPNSTFNGTPIDWNIARSSNDITSEGKNIIMLGLLSDSGLLTINADHPIRITHYLLLNGNMDLVGESQLLQDHGSILDNASAGWLERDQQGKMSSYNYNYWSSPVSTQKGDNNSGYTVGGVMWDGTNSNTPLPITFKDGYFVADGAKTNPLTISNYWIWKFHGTADTYGEWYYTGSTGSLFSGEGFTMKGTDGTVSLGAAQNYVFRGKPHNGNIPGLSIGKDQNYLIGNPYPSAIDGIKFLKDNLKDGGNNSINTINGALYFWDHFAGYTHILEEYIGGYATLNLLTSVEAASTDWRINATNEKSGIRPGNFIPVGQAFFVNTVPVNGSSMTINGGNIIFKNTQRIYQTETGSGKSIFLTQERKDALGDSQVQQQSRQVDEEKNSVIWFKFRSPKGYHRQIAVGNNSQATDGFDLGYDAPLIDNNIEDMFWFFENSKFVIQGIKEFTEDKELDIGVKISEKGELTIRLDDLQNFPEDLPILLKDELLNVIHNLREEPYKTESEAGTFTERFKIVFRDNTVVEPEPEEPEVGDFNILYVNGTREIFIMNPHKLEIEKVYLNNMLGQQVHMYYDIPTKNLIKLPVSRFGSGVYVVKVYSEEGITTKKVILE